jgi:uncharacterized protein YbjT (DUF2867 family)
MNVLIFGATGMVGQGVLRESLLAADVDKVVAVGRSASGARHPKLQDLLLPDLMNYAGQDEHLQGFDACFFCLGVSSAGMDEAQYTRLSYDLTLQAANVLSRLNPQMTFIYVSGAGTDSTGQGATMWARVKGRTESALRDLRFKAVYLFRPGVITPLHGARSKTASYRIFYTLFKPLLPLLRALLPRQILTTESVGRAMLEAVRGGGPQAVLESGDIYDLSRRGVHA